MTGAEYGAASPRGRGEHSVPARVRAWRRHPHARGTMWGAFHGERLVGVAILRPRLTADADQMAVLHVGSESRRRGIGSRLLAEACRLATQTGAPATYVTAAPTQSAAPFYLRHGFVPTGDRHPALVACDPDDTHMPDKETPA